MKQEALSAFQHGTVSAIAMLLFMAVFIGFIFFAYNKRNKKFFDQMAAMPLNNNEVEK